MVFCGRPSDGCANCRRKKKKCDGELPACSRCRKTAQLCYGYRHQPTIRFRNENAHVLRKACNAQRNKRHPESAGMRQGRQLIIGHHQPSYGAENNNGESATVVSSCTGHSRSFDVKDTAYLHDVPSKNVAALILPHQKGSHARNTNGYYPTIEQQAISFVAGHYDILELAESYNGSRLVSEENCHDLTVQTLSDVIISIGTAAISHVRRDSYLMIKALQRHSSALQHTQTILADNDRKLDYQAILIVLFLALYENITCNTPQSLQVWSQHIQGATTLLSLQQLNIINAQSLYKIILYLRKQVIIDCLQRRVPVPLTVTKWSLYIKSIMSKQQLWENSLVEIAIRLCEVRAFAGQFGRLDDKVIHYATAINARLDCWLLDIPKWLSYSIEHDVSNSGEFLFGCYHSYSELRAALIWNIYRTTRLLTNEVILDNLATVSEPTLLQIHEEASQRWLHQMTAEICSSLPVFFGYNLNPAKNPVKICAELCWPLYACAAQNYASPSTRDWVVRQFLRIGQLTGFSLSTSLANVLASGSEVTAWKDSCSSGSDGFTCNIEPDDKQWLS